MFSCIGQNVLELFWELRYDLWKFISNKTKVNIKEYDFGS